MKKPLPFVFLTTLFISGMLVGLMANSGSSAQPRRTGEDTDAQLVISTLAADTSINLACLQRLRSGEESVAISVLESHLDGELVMLGNRLLALPASQRDPQHLEVIRLFRNYRDKFPRTNSVSYIRTGLAQAYGLLAQKAKPSR